jgi:hypothetical protein
MSEQRGAVLLLTLWKAKNISNELLRCTPPSLRSADYARWF